MIPYFEIPKISISLKNKQNDLMAGLRRTASLLRKKSPVVIQMVEQQQFDPDMDFPKENWSPRRYEVNYDLFLRLKNPDLRMAWDSHWLKPLNKGGVFLENPDETVSKGLLGRRGKKRFITVPDETYFGWSEWNHVVEGHLYALEVDEKTYQKEVAVPINNWTEFLIIREAQEDS